MKNNKGFTLIELLGAVVILGILMGVAIPAVSKYLQRSKNESYDVMITSIHDGAMSYMMDKNKYPTTGSPLTIYIDKASIPVGLLSSTTALEAGGYVESLSDPGSSGKCGGTVVVSLNTEGDISKLPDYKYEINLECPSKTTPITKTIIS